MDWASKGNPKITRAGFICRDSVARNVVEVAQPLGITTEKIDDIKNDNIENISISTIRSRLGKPAKIRRL